LSGAGKSSIGNAIYKKISNTYGPTIIIHGDDFRKIWELNNYSNTGRYRNCVKYKYNIYSYRNV
jgi:adenylylsulfate kinase-like enzyme